jgi:hypothetical protein
VAAAESVGRNLPLAPSQVGTLHSICWRAMGGPEIAEAHVDDWNRDHPSLAITPAKKQARLDRVEASDGVDRGAGGGKWLEQLDRARGASRGG